MRKKITFLLSLASLLCISITARSELIQLKAKINGHQARLFFDSGTETYVLSRNGARRLGVKFTEPTVGATVPPGQVPLGTTERCTLTVEGEEVKTMFRVFDLPDYISLDFDGIIGWRGVRNSIVRIDARAHTLAFPAKVPTDGRRWQTMPTVKDSNVLQLVAGVTKGSKLILDIDTGSQDGVELPANLWKEWKITHARQPLTLESSFSPGDGVLVREQGWTDTIQLGSLVLSNVVVMEAAPSALSREGPCYLGTLGLAALEQFDLVIDGQNAVAYIHHNRHVAGLIPHNRLGAVFTPDHVDSDELVAHVAVGTPAQEAGVENGDVLLSVNGLAVPKWGTGALRLFSGSPGMKLNLKLKRDGKAFDVVAVLKNILGPGRHD